MIITPEIAAEVQEMTASEWSLDEVVQLKFPLATLTHLISTPLSTASDEKTVRTFKQLALI